MAAQDANLVDKLNGFWDWACDDPRVAGLLPWVRLYMTCIRILYLMSCCL